MAEPLDQALDLLRRLPPSRVGENLETIVAHCPELADDLYSAVDQPLSVRIDNSPEGAGREYLACDYNRDADSWRSPWSSTYDPPLEPEEGETVAAEGTQPSPELRRLEIAANEAFGTYRQLYFETGLSSVYLWDLDMAGAFAGVVLLKSDLAAGDVAGAWDSIHIFETSGSSKRPSYKLTSTVMLRLNQKARDGAEGDGVELAGSLTRQAEESAPCPEPGAHIANLGRMIEDMESKMRGQLQNVYFSKTTDILGSVRSVESLEKKRRERELQSELMNLWKR